jgi:HK97 family phage prohead protease
LLAREAPQQAAASPGEVPSVAEVEPSTDGTGLRVSGLLATWHQDSEGEAFLPNAFDKAAPAALAAGIPVLYQHEKASVPLGYVTDLKVRHDGLWVSAILPKPSGGRALELYEAVKAGSIRAWSCGGYWLRKNIGGKVKLLCDRLVEASLAALPINAHAGFDSVASVVGVKSYGGRWLPTTAAYELKSIMGELGGLEYLAAGLTRERQQAADLEAVEVAVARARLGMRFH